MLSGGFKLILFWAIVLAGSLPVVLCSDLYATRSATEGDQLVFNACVRVANGMAVTGLTRDDFTVLVDNKAVAIGYFGGADAPESVSLIVDTSATVRGHSLWKTVVGQLKRVAEQSNLGSEFLLLTLSGAPRIVTDWTFDKKALAQAISTLGDQESKGRNALYDACILAINKRRQTMDRKNFILLTADGRDGGSKADFNQLRTALRSSLTTVFCIPLIDPYDSQGGLWMGTLEQIAFPSGGDLVFLSSQQQVADAIDRFAIWMKHAYQIGLRTDDLPRDGKYHKLSVKAAHIGEKDGNKRTFIVAAPQGFLAEH